MYPTSTVPHTIKARLRLTKPSDALTACPVNFVRMKPTVLAAFHTEMSMIDTAIINRTRFYEYIGNEFGTDGMRNTLTYMLMCMPDIRNYWYMLEGSSRGLAYRSVMAEILDLIQFDASVIHVLHSVISDRFDQPHELFIHKYHDVRFVPNGIYMVSARLKEVLASTSDYDSLKNLQRFTQSITPTSDELLQLKLIEQRSGENIAWQTLLGQDLVVQDVWKKATRATLVAILRAHSRYTSK